MSLSIPGAQLLTQYVWSTPVQMGAGTVQFSPTGGLSIKPTTTTPSNSLSGSYQITGANTLTTSSLASTLMGVQDPSTEQFMKELWNNRQIPFAVTVQPNTAEVAQLTVLDTQGNAVQFRGQITPEAKFQSPGDLGFFEIQPSATSQSGFDVRELTLDPTTFVVVQEGPWVHYNNEINGLTLNKNEAIGVRVKRFTVPQSDSTFRFVYINDLVYSRTVV